MYCIKITYTMYLSFQTTNSSNIDNITKTLKQEKNNLQVIKFNIQCNNKLQNYSRVYKIVYD